MSCDSRKVEQQKQIFILIFIKVFFEHMLRFREVKLL